MYRCTFFNTRRPVYEKEYVMGLEINGSKRTEILYNILSSEWVQEGDFIIDDTELPSIIYDFVQIISDVEKYEEEEMEYRLKFHGQFNLSLGPLLSSGYKNIGSMDIIRIFCDCIVECWQYNYDHLDISYNIEKE